MFPTVRVSFSGPLRYHQPAERYAVLLDIVPMDNRRYRYAYHRSNWLVAGKADPPPPARRKFFLTILVFSLFAANLELLFVLKPLK